MPLFYTACYRFIYVRPPLTSMHVLYVSVVPIILEWCCQIYMVIHIVSITILIPTPQVGLQCIYIQGWLIYCWRSHQQIKYWNNVDLTECPFGSTCTRHCNNIMSPKCNITWAQYHNMDVHRGFCCTTIYCTSGQEVLGLCGLLLHSNVPTNTVIATFEFHSFHQQNKLPCFNWLKADIRFEIICFTGLMVDQRSMFSGLITTCECRI